MASLTTIEKMMLIRQVPIFAELDADDLEELAAIVEERRIEPHRILFREGDAGDAVYLIVKGLVRCSRGRRAPRTAGRRHDADQARRGCVHRRDGGARRGAALGERASRSSARVRCASPATASSG